MSPSLLKIPSPNKPQNRRYSRGPSSDYDDDDDGDDDDDDGDDDGDDGNDDGNDDDDDDVDDGDCVGTFSVIIEIRFQYMFNILNAVSEHQSRQTPKIQIDSTDSSLFQCCPEILLQTV